MAFVTLFGHHGIGRYRYQEIILVELMEEADGGRTWQHSGKTTNQIDYDAKQGELNCWLRYPRPFLRLHHLLSRPFSNERRKLIVCTCICIGRIFWFDFDKARRPIDNARRN